MTWCFVMPAEILALLQHLHVLHRVTSRVGAEIFSSQQHPAPPAIILYASKKKHRPIKSYITCVLQNAILQLVPRYRVTHCVDDAAAGRLFSSEIPSLQRGNFPRLPPHARSKHRLRILPHTATHYQLSYMAAILHVNITTSPSPTNFHCCRLVFVPIPRTLTGAVTPRHTVPSTDTPR